MIDKQNLLLPDYKIQLATDIKYKKIGSRYFWISPEKGVFVVLNHDEHQILAFLKSGLSPVSILQRLSAVADEDSLTKKWNNILGVVVKLARSGFVCGVRGETYPYTLNPERFARLHITKKCQLRCIHCYANSSPDCPTVDELPTTRWKTFIEDFARNGGTHLLLTGGEPLLRHDITDLLECGKKNGLSIRMLTNGLLVPKYISVLTETLSGIQISLGSPEEKSNDLIRGKGTYKKILRTIDMLVKTPLQVQVGITAMPQNIQAIEKDFLQLAQRYNGAGIKFHIGMGVCRHGRGCEIESDFDTEQNRFKLLSLLAEANQVPTRKVICETLSCGYCEQIVIGPDGNIYPCHLLEGTIGHIDKIAIQKLVPRLRTLSELHQVSYMETCKDCDLRKVCGGTCRIVNKKLTGSKLKPACSQEDRAEKLRNLIYWATT